MRRRTLFPAVSLILLFGLASACSLNSSKKQYVLAEKLWIDGKYKPAVSEFEKVYARDPKGQLGHQALFRAAMTQAYFLSQYAQAVQKFRTYVQIAHDPASITEAERQIGELLFSRLDLYDQAAPHYLNLLAKMQPQQKKLKDEAPLYRFRVAKSYFYLWRFDAALENYRALIHDYPDSAEAEKAVYEIGVTLFTRAEQNQQKGIASKVNPFSEAVTAYEAFIQKYPRSELVSQARFGIASCLEEMDQLDAAYQAYQQIKSSYPSPKIIDIKLARIHERQIQRNR